MNFLLDFTKTLAPNNNQPSNQQQSPNQSPTKTPPIQNAAQSYPFHFMNVFKNNQMLKQELLMSNFYHALIGQQQTHKVTQTKITPALLINKIQQSRPLYKNSVVFKQLAFDMILETEKTYKMKNCISPARPNSQVYKRLSKNFFQNIKNGVDQCILFTGMEPMARVESSIGNQANPGLFMIIAIAVLDQKYKENHERFDVEFSFLQYRGEKVYDLINYTEVPLEAKMRENASGANQTLSSIEFCQHRVKVCTFLQFIKLFKIALFNNKQRDIKTNKDGSHNQTQKSVQFQSSFIMKIRIKKYNLQSELVYEQETALIDMDENSSLRSNQQRSEKSFEEDMREIHHEKKGSDAANRSLMDYILIEINNSNPSNKPMHYHMVEKNLLLQMVKKYLRQKELKLPENLHKLQPKNIVPSFATKQESKEHYVGGALFIINSFTTNPYNYNQNIKLFQNITSAIGNDWQALVKSKTFFNKCFDLSYAGRILDKVVNILKHRKYQSLRGLYVAKEFFVKETKKIISDIKMNRNIILDYLNQKKNLTYSQNVFAAYEFQLIGNCIKSDNFKDFYTSKSYLALPRQIQIKTEHIKTEIINGMQNLKQVEQRYNLLKKKEKEEKKLLASMLNLMKSQLKETLVGNNKKKNGLKPEHTKQKRRTNTKFRLLDAQNFDEHEDLDSFNSLRKYIYDYFSQIWAKTQLTQERTVTDQLIFEEFFTSQITSLKERFVKFIQDVKEIEDVNIEALDEQKMVDLENLTQLVRSINQAKKSILKHEPKHPGRSPFAVLKSTTTNVKNKSNHRTENCLPRIQQSISKKKEKSNSTKELDDKRKSQVFEIKAKVDFCSMILNPKRVS